MPTIDDFEDGLTPFSKTLNTIIGLVIRRWVDWLIIPRRREFDEDWKEHEIIERAKLGPLFNLAGPLTGSICSIYVWLGEHSIQGYPCRLLPLASAYMRIGEELGRGDSAVSVSFGCKFWPFTPIMFFPHANYKLFRDLVPYFLWGCTAMTEPQGGSDIEDFDLQKGRTIQTTAELHGDEWVINGHKIWPTNSGGEAKIFGVVCTTKKGSDDPKDFAYIYVPADTPGVTQGEPYKKAGMAADKNSDIWFDNVKVPKYYRAFGPGKDYEYFGEVIVWGTVGTAGYCSGVLLNIYEIIKEYCSKKTIAGKPLKENPAVAAELGEIAIKIQTARLLAYQYSRTVDKRWEDRWKEEVRAKGRLTENYLADTALEVAERALDLMGLYGGDRNEDIEKHWRDVKIMQLWMGGKQLGQAETARWFYECVTI